MALETEVIELPIEQGQNEGTERALLPAGQFSYVQNARFRKNRRLGKRNGYTSVGSLDASGAAMGNGNGRTNCVGPWFACVDDRFYRRNSVDNTWSILPPSLIGGIYANTRLPWRFPQFMPGPSFETLPVQSDTNLGGWGGTSGASIGGITVGLGLIWCCCGYFNVPANKWLVSVTATDPETGDVVFDQDVAPEITLAVGDRFHPMLLSTSDRSTVVLIYDRFTAGTKSHVCTRVLTSLTAGFGAETAFACIQSAFNYDPYASNSILFTYTLTATPSEVTIARVNPSTLVATASATYPLGGNKTLLSCYGVSSGLVWTGFTDASNGVQVRAYDATLTGTGTSANLSVFIGAPGCAGPITFALRTSTSVVALAEQTGTPGAIVAADVDTGGSLSGRQRQYGCKQLSQPFNVDGLVYVWVRHIADAQLGVATLLRVPTNAEFGGATVSPYTRAWPVQATVDGRDIDEPVSADTAGPIYPTPVASDLGYCALINYTRVSIIAGGTSTLVRGFFVAPVRHRSEGVRYAPSCVVPCVGKFFIAGAQPMWVDKLGAYEGGFVQSPVIVSATAAGSGDLTASFAYSYSASYESLDSNGMIERSGPASPVEYDSTAGTSSVVTFTPMALGQREVRIKLWRNTAAAPSIFKLLTVVNGSPASTIGTISFTDSYDDADIEQNETLYVNVGQELPASQFPSCSFANVGGNRLWVAGGFSGTTWTASKLFATGIAPEFADDDAFRDDLPANITGSAWLDSQVFFTQEGIYIITGDGPDGSGVGFFTTTELPFQIGCIDWRSVVATDIGIFFQSARGLYLLPRGFGEPIAMGQVLDTLTTYPIITSARANFSSRGGADNTEQVVQWTAVSDEAATSGVVITYDIAYKAFYVDTCRADYPATFQAGWGGDSVQAPSLVTVGPGGASKWHPFRVRDTSFDDEGQAVEMRIVTGDVRPWGFFSHGVINRAGLLGQLRSACTVAVDRTTDRGVGHTAQRVYTAAGTPGEPAAGSDIYLEVPLGKTELRDVTALRVSVEEDSTSEGVALFGLAIEKDRKPQGFRLLGPADRVQ